MKTVTIIDYGLSNIYSVEHAFAFCGASTIVTNNIDDIIKADVLVLPGVGAFQDGMNKLQNLNLIDITKEKANMNTPILGICLGMQLFFNESEEFGLHTGLGLIPGRIERIPSEDINGNKQKIPHISWNPLYPANKANNFNGNILESIKPGEECYFIHSFEAKPHFSSHCIAETTYGGRKICAAVQNKNIIGTQFHPEKSGEIGLKIIKKFIENYC